MGEDQRRAILAVVLSGLVLFSWQYFMGSPIEVTQNDVIKKDMSSSEVLKNSELQKEVVVKDSLTQKVDIQNLQQFTLKNNKSSFVVDNFLNVLESTTTISDKNFSDIFTKSNTKILFSNNSLLSQLFFNFEKVADDTFKISNPENEIFGTLFLDEKGYLNFNLQSKNLFNYVIRISEEQKRLDSGQQTQFAFYDKNLELVPVGDEETGDKNLGWVGLDFNYHLMAVVLEKEKNYVYKSKENGSLDVRSSSSVNAINLKYIFTKKEYDHLISLGNNLELSVDFGIWSVIAVPILRGLQFFFSVFPNYGISIILLTLIIRMLTFPLQYKSFKSMKKMQDIQPDLNKVREKYKDNPQKMQQETMALFKRAGANPLSGCLPLLLQMPIFFAFYKVLYSAVELVDAPFYLWIVDLSEKDPYYVLPILMAAAMVLQQKLTPATTADPMQKKLMTFMPLMFAIFMKDLPAGLTLYIFVSTIIGMSQQLLVFKRA